MRQKLRRLVPLALAALLGGALYWYYDVFVNWNPRVFPFAVAASILAFAALAASVVLPGNEIKPGKKALRVAVWVAAFVVVQNLTAFLVNNVFGKSGQARLAMRVSLPLLALLTLLLFAKPFLALRKKTKRALLLAAASLACVCACLWVTITYVPLGRLIPAKTTVTKGERNMSPMITPEDMALCERYTKDMFASPGALPISFTYEGQAYRGMPEHSVVTRRELDENIISTTIAGTVGSLRITAECLAYRDFPVAEWTVWFSCADGYDKTGILADVLGADMVFAIESGGAPTLVHNNGDFGSKDGYTVGRTVLKDGEAFAQAPTGGRPSDRAFPYQRLLFDTYGINISIGWPGQWACEYRGGGDGVAFKAGQAVSRTTISAGEAFRTPRMTLQFFEGGEARGVNIWRRWFNAHVTPRKADGDILAPFFWAADPNVPPDYEADPNVGVEFTFANEAGQLAGIAHAKESLPYNGWWIDAGWYPCEDEDGVRRWPLTGDWYPDPERFPNGLAPVGRAAREAGMQLLLWFEPERVSQKSRFAKEHPEWMLARKDINDSCLLNLGNPECRQWLSEYMADFLIKSGVTVYRQDFNFEPLPYWRENEADDRQGMLENLHVQGYLAYWDYLLAHVPGLWIDSCASGGRRNDLETMRRAVPLHPTDYGYGNHPVLQAFRHTLFSWIPFTRSWASSWDKDGIYSDNNSGENETGVFDNFKAVNSIGVASSFGGGGAYARQMYGIWEKASEIMLRGDFYALTENHRDSRKWTVFQFDRPEEAAGVFQVIRNTQAYKEESLTVYPYGFSDSAAYVFTNDETGERFTIRGREINETGVTFTLPLRAGAIWFYAKGE